MSTRRDKVNMSSNQHRDKRNEQILGRQGNTLDGIETAKLPSFVTSHEHKNFGDKTLNQRESLVKKLNVDRNEGLKVRQFTQDFSTLHKKCLDSKLLFEDPEFPTTDNSLFYSRLADRRYIWLRPKDICKEPRFFVKGFSRFDVRQGSLGNCWLLAAAASLTHDSKLFSKVICEENSFEKNYAGIFHFRFWRFGEWIEVVIDDRLPTYRGELVFMHSSEKNEFWSALLEKAYAKLHGTYEALDGGSTCEALQDLTGGITEIFELKNAPSNLFTILEKAYERNSLMGCSINANPNIREAETPQGLICGHAYSITKICMVDISTSKKAGKIPLLRLRNPWGNETEWNGAFSDKSREWSLVSNAEKERIGLNFGHDGEFWMSFQDFMKYFHRIDICNLSPDELSGRQEAGLKKIWNMSIFEGEWAAGISAGGCRNNLATFHHNPQYVVTLEDPDENDDSRLCTVVVALMQKNRRSKRSMGLQFLFIGFSIYKVTEANLTEKPLKLNFFIINDPVADSPAFSDAREISCRFHLPPGQYLIVPSTYDANEEGEFLIRVFSEKANTLKENDEQIEIGKADSKIVSGILSNIQPDSNSAKIDKLFQDTVGSDSEIDWVKLKQILDYAMRDIIDFEGFSKDICRSMVSLLDVNHSGSLGLDEFKKLLDEVVMWKAAFRMYDKDNTNRLNTFQLREALGSAGYHLNIHILIALVHRFGSSDKMIAFDDFIMCAVKVKKLIEVFKKKDRSAKNQATFSLEEWIKKAI